MKAELANQELALPNISATIDEIAAFPEQNPNPVFGVDADGCLTYANAASATLLADWGVRGRGEPLPPMWRARAAAALADGQPAKWDVASAGGILQLHIVPIVQHNRVNVYAADVTDLRRAREEFERRAEAQMAHQSNLLAQVNDAVIATDADRRITAWNHAAERMFGWSEAEAIGRRAADRLPTEFVEMGRDEISRSLLEQGQWRGELVITARSGRRVHIEATSVLLRDVDGRVTGQVGVGRDISRRKVVEAQNARLLAELTASREQMAALSQRLVAAHEAERIYVADQLYNQAGQVLTALQLQLARLGRGDAGEQMPAIDATLNEAIGELHALASQLRPFTLDRATLAGALRAYALEFGKTHALTVRFDAGNAETARPRPDVATSLFRAAQEGLANIARHSAATRVRIALRVAGDMLLVTLADNGIGFDPTEAALSGGLGLASIRERLKTVGGLLLVESAPGGTTLTLSAPLDHARPA